MVLYRYIVNQWGYAVGSTGNGDIINLPIAFPNDAYMSVGVDVGSGCFRVGIRPNSTSNLILFSRRSEHVFAPINLYYLTIGK